jgi:hypothetical protein
VRAGEAVSCVDAGEGLSEIAGQAVVHRVISHDLTDSDDVIGEELDGFPEKRSAPRPAFIGQDAGEREP